MDDEIKTGEMTGEIDESITVEEDFTLLEGKAVSINDDSDNKTKEEEVYEEALDVKESLDDIRQQIKDKLLNILEKGKITDADSCEIELLNDQYNEKYNELKDLANTVIPGGKGTSIENASTTDNSTTEIVKINIDYDEILKTINEKADWLYIDEDGQVMLNGEVVPKLKVVELEAEKIKADVGEFKELTAENFTATNAEIENLKANKADIEYLTANYATIQNLNATNAEITNLKSDYGEFKNLTAENFTAVNADIDNLTANKADVDYLTSNYATINMLNTNVADINTALIDKANVSDLNATNALVEDLRASKADVADLTAVNAKITNLEAGKADIAVLEANYATIKQLDATNANVTNLQTETANINKALINKADVADLNATNANVTNLQATKADVSDLNAAKANISTLTSDLAEVTTLVNGNLTSDNIQSMVITGEKFTVADGFIKNAMIDSVNANKINAGSINTNNVTIQSNDGSMLLQGSLQQFKDKNGKVRIQIGKDAAGNFTFVLYDENGTGQLINQNGIQSSNAIADGLIIDSKVADNANIAGSKLDIDSVVTEVNNGSTSIKGTKIYLDDQSQSLDVAFNNMTTTVNGNTSTLNSHTTSINTMNGKITQLISDTTITKQDGTTTSLKDAYNSTVDTVNSHTQTIGSLETNLSKVSTGQNKWLLEMFEKGDGIDDISPITIKDTIGKPLRRAILVDDSVTSNQSQFDNYYLGRATTYVYLDEDYNWETTATSDDGSTIYINGAAIATLTSCAPTAITVPFKQGWNKITWVYNEGIGGDGWDFNPRLTTLPQVKYMNAYPMTNVDEIGNILDGDIKTVSSKQTALEQNLDGFKQTVSETYATNASLTNVSNNLQNNYSTTSAMNSAIEQKANEITSSVSQTYATKESLTTVDNKFANYSTTSAMNSAIEQKANEITSSVSETYATKTSVTDLSNNLTNNYSTTSAMNSAIDQKSDAILSTVSKTYATQTSLTDVSNNLKNNYSTTSAMNSAINQKANEITSSVSETYATKKSVSDVSNNLKNNYSTTSAMNSAINQKANEITSSVSETYATKTALSTVDNKFANYSTTSQMNSAIQQKSDSILSTVSNTYTTKTDFNKIATGQNKWLLEVFDRGNVAGTDAITIRDLVDKPLKYTRLIDDTTTYWSIAETYLARLTTNVYLDADYSWTVGAKSDDGGTLYLNGKVIATTTTTQKDVTLPFKKGWNKITWVYNENAGDDGAVFATKISSLSQIKNMNAYPVVNFDEIGMAINNDLKANYSTTSAMNSAINQKANEITSSVSETYATKASLTTVDNKFANYSTTSAMNTAINQKSDAILSTVSSTYATKTALKTTDDKFANYSTTSQMNSAINQKANEITSTVSNTYATKAALNTVDGKFADYSTTSAMNTAINQKSDSILSTVSSTYATKTALNTVDGKFANYSTTSAMNSAINQKGDSILSTVSSNYTTKADFNGLKIGGTNLFVRSDCGDGYIGVDADNIGQYVPSSKNHQTMRTLIPTNGNTKLIYQVWNPNKVINNVNTNRVAFFNDSRTFISNYTVPQLNGNEYQISIIDMPANTAYIRLGAMMGPNADTIDNAIKIKFEFGNKATDWTPAPQDINASITAVDNKFVNYATINQMNSSIDQKANEINLNVSNNYATKTSVTDLNNNLSNNYSTTQQMNSAIDIAKSSIKLDVSNNYASKHEVAHYFEGENKWKLDVYSLGSMAGSARPTKESMAQSNCQYQSSMLVEHPSYLNDYTNNYVGYATTYMHFTEAYQWTGRVITDDNGTVYLNDVLVSNVTTCQWADITLNFRAGWNKIEVLYAEGIGGDGWQFNPEIIVVPGGVLDKMNCYGQNSTEEYLKANYSTTQQMNSSIEQKANEITSSVSSMYSTKTETDDKIHNVRVGGTNLFRGTTNLDGLYWASERASLTDSYYRGSRIYRVSYAWADYNYPVRYLFEDDVIELNTEYTFSCYARTNNDGYRPNLCIYGDSAHMEGHGLYIGTVGAEWRQYSGKIKFYDGDRSYPLRIEPTTESGDNNVYIEVCGLQLEKGNKATDWSPAPQDVDASIEAVDGKFVNYSTIQQMNSAIDQKADSITQSVSSTYATKTDLNTANGNISSLTNRMQSAESKLTKDSLTTTIGNYYTTSSDVNGLITAKGYATTSQLQQTATDLTATFNDGYNQGITQINKDGIKVTQSGISGYSQMNANGFYIHKGNEDIFKVDSNGLYLKGNVTVTSGSLPSSLLTGTIDNKRLNSSIVNGANNGTSAKSTLDSKASGWDSTKSTVDSNKTNWDNAYNRVVDWAYGAVGGTTTINGGLVQTNTITTKQLAIGDFNNYSQLRPYENLSNRYGSANWGGGDGHFYWSNNDDEYLPFTINETANPFKQGDKVGFKFEAYAQVEMDVRIGVWFYSSDDCNGYMAARTAGVHIYPGWNSYSAQVNIDCNEAKYARSVSIMIYKGVNNYIEVRNVVISRMINNVMIEDGAITANKISAGAVTADKINVSDLSALNASVGGFHIYSGKLVGTGGNGVGMSGNAEDWAFWAGSNTGGNAPFHVGHEGNLYATQAHISGTITASTISGSTINGTTINSDSFIGDMLAIDGTISAKSLQVQDIDNAKYPATLDGNLELYVNSESGNDDNEPDDDVRFKTLQGAIDAIPKFLNGKTVYITMETDSTEDVYMRGFVGGAIRIYMNGKTLYGTLRSYVCAASISVYGGTKDSTEGATGVIHPNVGLSFGTRAVSVGFEASQYAALYKIKVYAPDNIPSDISNTDKVCIASQSGTGSVYCKNIQIVNAVIGFRTNNHGSIHVNSSSGVASKYGFQAVTGGIISMANNNQAGGKTANTNKSSGGQIWHDTNGPTFATGNQTTDGGTAPVAPTTKTLTIKSSYGDTYRSTVYNSWKRDGSVRAGDYGYGDCNGCWFFGSAFSEVKGKTISKVEITITRNSGGKSSAVGLVVKSHGHSGRPSGAPTYRTTAGTLSLATGATGKLTITNSTILNEISSGTVKGFGIQNTYDSNNYAVCSGSCTVKITYRD